MACKISIGHGLFAVVDDADADLGGIAWHALKSGRTVYAAHSVSSKVKVLLHRVIALRFAGAAGVVDHVNGDGLDCRRLNLRVVAAVQNFRNRRRNLNNTSGFHGVHFSRRDRRFLASIGVDGIKVHLGSFTSAEDAARARDVAARKFFGKFATLNFPTGEERRAE